MKFSLWMLLNTLAPFEPVTYIRTEEKRNIENLRLYSSDDDRKESVLYIAKSNQVPLNHADHVICMHADNYILLNTNDISLVFNSVLSFFEEKQAWYYELSSMLSGHCLLKDVLNHFSSVIERPLMVLDASQIVLAHSANFGPGSIDDPWDHMLNTGSFGVNVINEYNQRYQRHIQDKEAYLVPAGPFPHPNYSRNLFMDNEFIGFFSMILKGSPLQNEEIDWFDIAYEAIFKWLSLYADNNEITMKQSLFKEILEGNLTNISRFGDALGALGWAKNCPKRLFVLSCISSYLSMGAHIARILNQKTDQMYAVSHENEIAVLVNEDRIAYADTLQEYEPLLHSSGYYGGSSNVFTDLADFPDSYALAKIALTYGPVSPGKIHACHDYVLPYVFRLLKTHMKLELCHPAILTLRSYDQENGTDLCKLLYTYLQNECSQTKTAEALNMHRNSLIRKICRIQELCHADLADYETRFHLMMSFEYQKHNA